MSIVNPKCFKNCDEKLWATAKEEASLTLCQSLHISDSTRRLPGAMS